jgi:hypothetical protein
MNIKQSICQAVSLTYFDPQKETIVQVDASLRGLGSALVQDGKVVAFASKALTHTEKRYANIEREMLAKASRGQCPRAHRKYRQKVCDDTLDFHWLF